ncbi:unnamed protein product [Phytophthora fragariaefolia]|uniref:Unnamed protein product n=1 Tax=Phytophthora fragariaefolia TaxID=1490495 RepID=A0A9W7CZ60_9STRA|nr:unnamed protein product [Phytophthora fragariaefolia]
MRHFTDMELGKFMDRMAEGALNDTIVVIVGGHDQAPESDVTAGTCNLPVPARCRPRVCVVPLPRKGGLAIPSDWWSTTPPSTTTRWRTSQVRVRSDWCGSISQAWGHLW